VIEANQRYRTSQAEVAAYLRATGVVRLVGTEMNRGTIEFIFDINREQGREHEQNMLHVSMPAAKLFKSLREVRNMIHQQRETNKQFQGELNNVRSQAISAVR